MGEAVTCSFMFVLVVVLLGQTPFECTQVSSDREGYVQSKKNSQYNTTHWECVERAIQTFRDESQNDNHIKSLLNIDNWYEAERNAFLEKLANNPIGQHALNLAETAEHVIPWNPSSFLEASTQVMESNPSSWPCNCGEEKCSCETICETCEVEDSPEARHLLDDSYLLQQQPEHLDIPVDLDAEADKDTLLDSRNKIRTNVVTSRSVGWAGTLSAALQLDMETTQDDEEQSKGECSGCKTECYCTSECSCELPAPNKDHCKLAHAALLQCEIVCLPIFPFDLICYAFSNCASKCAVEGVEGFPDALARVCKAFCGCKKFCIEG